MTTLIHQRVESARRGENPTVICQMPSGWVVLSDKQLLPGYCLLLPDPVTSGLNDMDDVARAQFLADMVVIGDALLEVTGGWRVNYEILGNTEPVLHAHIIPRYMSEPEALRKGPVWFYPFADAPAFDAEKDRPLMEALARAIQSRIKRDSGRA